MGLFKKKAPKKEIVEKIVEVPMKSRFTFAHDANTHVFAYFFNPENKVSYPNLSADTVFTYTNIPVDGSTILFPIFKMPKSLPTTRLVSNKKIVCIGTIMINSDCEIYDVCNKFVGWSLEEMVAYFGLLCPSEETMVCAMNKQFVVEKELEGDISFDKLKRYCVVSDTINKIMNV